jgi:hypothetical protein
VAPIDPLLLQNDGKARGAQQFGATLIYRFEGSAGGGTVEVKFSELPVDRWHNLSSDEKRQLGITNAPCVSIMRADREIDRGWYFMGAKRRENYDDWWRCEISFQPSLDEFFGITHTKQGISPRDELLRALQPDLESIARALNVRVRKRFEFLKLIKPLGAAEQQAAKAESALPALPRQQETMPEALRELLAGHAGASNSPICPYRILVADLPSTAAFEILRQRGQLVMLLNARHPLYRDLYGPLAMSDSDKDQDIAKRVALVILAAARAEAGATRQNQRAEVHAFRQAWADVLATFFNA